jgi:Ca2+-binding EF-hand superfamily protein
MLRFIAAFGVAGAAVVEYKRRQLRQQDDEGRRGAPLTLAARFAAFSSAPDQSYLTMADFTRSVLLAPSTTPSPSSSSASNGEGEAKEKESHRRSAAVLRNLFKMMDGDGDNQLSYAEYCVFFSLISVPDDLFRVAFTMFDRDGNGRLDFNEFRLVVEALKVDPTADVNLENSRIARHLFGPQRDRTLTFAKFLDLVHKMRWEMRRAEFEEFDQSNPGRITLADLRRIVFKDDPVRSKLQPRDKELTVPWSTYRKLFDVLLDSETIARAMELYQESKASCGGDGNSAAASGGGEAEDSVRRPEFARALRCGNVSNITPEEVDIFFRLFDTDGSNTVSSAEFREMCNVRNSFYATAMPSFDEPSRTGPQQFLYCMKQRV